MKTFLKKLFLFSYVFFLLSLGVFFFRKYSDFATVVCILFGVGSGSFVASLTFDFADCFYDMLVGEKNPE